VAVLERLAEARGLPLSITVDHGPEFEGQVLDAWAYRRGVQLNFIRPGKPVENAYIESFNGRFRDECLNEHWFVTMAHARQAIEAWRIEYNHVSCCPTYLCVGKLKDTLICIACCRVMPAVLDAPDQLGCGRRLQRAAIKHPRSIGDWMLCLDFAARDRQA
jgi:hypothetical protein